MALTADEQNRIASLTAQKIFGDTGEICTVNTADLIAAADAIIARLEANVVAGDAGTRVDALINQSIPSPVSTLTQAKRSVIVAITIAVAYGGI